MVGVRLSRARSPKDAKDHHQHRQADSALQQGGDRGGRADALQRHIGPESELPYARVAPAYEAAEELQDARVVIPDGDAQPQGGGGGQSRDRRGGCGEGPPLASGGERERNEQAQLRFDRHEADANPGEDRTVPPEVCGPEKEYRDAGPGLPAEQIGAQERQGEGAENGEREDPRR